MSVRILYVIDSLSGGGAERSLASLAPHYAARGAILELAHLQRRSDLREEFEQAGVEVFTLAGPRGRLGWIERARRLVRERRPDVIHTTLFESDVVGRTVGALTGVPVVSSLVNVAYSEVQLSDPRLRPWKVRVAQMVDAATARRVVRFHAITDHVADEMTKRLRIPRELVDVVPRGRDAARLGRRSCARRSSARSTLGVDDHAPVVLAAARQEFQKGLDLLLEALPLVLEVLPDARLLVAGREGNQTDELRGAVGRLGLVDAVRFLGARSDVSELMCAADVFAFPSRWEGLGSVLIEAMALEAPIVASDLPPVREVVGGEAGARLVPPGHPESLARAIAAAITKPAETAMRVAFAHQRFQERYTIERVADAMMAFYERALGGQTVNA